MGKKRGQVLISHTPPSDHHFPLYLYHYLTLEIVVKVNGENRGGW
jgi:hypothetical protein